MELLVPFVLASLIVGLFDPAAAAAAPQDAPRNGGFRLRLVSSPGWNSTVHVDGDGLLHLNQPLCAPKGLTYSVGTGHGRRTYALALDTASSLMWMQCVPCSHPFAQTPAPSPSFRSVPPAGPLRLPPNPQHPSRHSRCEFHATRLDCADRHGFLLFGDDAPLHVHQDPVHGVKRSSAPTMSMWSASATNAV